VKTRIGYRSNEVDSWLGQLLEAEPAAVTIHARTRNEQSLVPARWDVVGQAVRLRDEVQKSGALRTLIIGNGDVPDPRAGRQQAAKYGCDGVMIGRGIFGNPWLFNPDVHKERLSIAEILDVMLEHTAAYIELFDGIKPIELMKKHFKAYANGFPGASQLRIELMAAADYAEIAAAVRRFCAAAPLSSESVPDELVLVES
jgi:tRNA-dihydrouridine synthase